MEKIAIYVGPYAYGRQWDETNLESRGIGGSEIWAARIAVEFARGGYDVWVFGDPETEHDSPEGVHYRRWENFGRICREERFDHIITSRRVDAIDNSVPCDDIILMTHDILVIGCETYEDLKPERVRKICFQSLSQKLILQKRYGIPDDKFMRTFQAIDMEPYADADDSRKENCMLWSTGINRGLRRIAEDIIPRVRKVVPDFTVYVSHYQESIGNTLPEGMVFLGNLPKSELVRYQRQSKVFTYPNTGLMDNGGYNGETFSITTIENAMAGAVPVLGRWGCWFSTLKGGYDGFAGDGLYENILKPMDPYNIPEFVNELSAKTVRCLTDEKYRTELAAQARDICGKYTWQAAAATFTDNFLK